MFERGLSSCRHTLWIPAIYLSKKPPLCAKNERETMRRSCQTLRWRTGKRHAKTSALRASEGCSCAMRVPADAFWSARRENPVENDRPEHAHRHAAGQQSRRFARSRMISARKSGARELQIRFMRPRDEATEGGAKAGAHGFAVGSRRARERGVEHMGCATAPLLPAGCARTPHRRPRCLL